MRDLIWFFAVVVAAASAPLYNLTLPDEEYYFEEAPATLECPQLYDEKMMREV